jgi:putative endonuclease
MDRRTLGSYGEKAAEGYLLDQGYTILDRNWRCEHGEVDIIAQREQTVVFVEVRTRSSSRYGTPEESITRYKAERLVLTMQMYLEDHALHHENWRIDLIAIECDPSGNVQRLDHYPNALTDYLDQLS